MSHKINFWLYIFHTKYILITEGFWEITNLIIICKVYYLNQMQFVQG